MLNLEWFRTFKAIYETGTLSAAAQVLFISQPGVSLHLSSLESYTGYRLFERETKGMLPTDKAVMLYNFLTDPLNKLERAEELFHRNSKFEKATITVGMRYENFIYGLEEYVPELPFNLIVRFGEDQQMLHDLDAGKLDLILTTQKGQQATLEYKAFAKERIVLICGASTETEELQELICCDQRARIKGWLKNQIWYTNSADMELLKNFWSLNFNSAPDFTPNFVMPYFSTILHSLSHGQGLAVVPDFLCSKYLDSGSIKLVWEGSSYLENSIYFGKAIKSIYSKEIEQMEEILSRNWKSFISEK